MRLRQILASSCRQKILETLAGVDQIHMMELIRKTNSTHSQVNRNLKILEKENLVTVKYYGRLKIIRLERESERTQTLLKVLYTLNKPALNPHNSD